jgi:H+/Cl- antiporter ClcA
VVARGRTSPTEDGCAWWPGELGYFVTAPVDPLEILRSRAYLRLLLMAAIIGVPISALAYGFLKLTAVLQRWTYTQLPGQLGFDQPPWWWPIPLLAAAGLLVGLTIGHLPGRGGHSPADGFHAGGPPPTPAEVVGIALAALVTLSLGAVLGPEAPLIAIGAGLGAWGVRLVNRGAPEQAVMMIAAAGSFAAIATLLGSPLRGAFLLMEAAGVSGALLDVVLLPGLLSAGIGALVFVGLQHLTGFGTFSLALPDLPAAGPPSIAQFGWAIAIGLLAPVLATGIRRLALVLRTPVERHLVLLTPVVGLGIAALAIAYSEITGKGTADVLFSGQDQIGPLLANAADYTVGTLLLVLACKGLAYGASLAAFRGGPVFPSMFLGAAGGMALSHAPGLPMVAGVAMGIGAMSAAMLRLPLTAVLLATLLLFSDGLEVMPLVIVAVVVSHVTTARLTPRPVAPARPAPADPPTARIPG